MKKWICFISIWFIALASNNFIANTIQHTWQILIDSINTGDQAKVALIVPQYIQADEKTTGGKTVLEHTLRAKQPEVVDYLLSTMDLDEFVQTRSNGELLDIIIPAIELGKLEIIKAIIPAALPADQRSKGGKRLSSIAKENEHPEIADYIENLLD